MGLDRLRPARFRSYLNRRLKSNAAARLPFEQVCAERLGVCVPVRNRSGARVENFLRTLRAQTVPESCVDLTVCDFGSDADELTDVTARCRQHRARLVALHDDRVEWNKSLALNAALRHTPESCRYLFPTDIDMLFAPNFVETVLRAHLAWGEALVLCEFKDLPREALRAETDVVAEFAALDALGELAGDHAVGPCLSASREWYFKVRGFDERMRLWGFMDLDIQRRAQRDGLPEVWINSQTVLLHQWHARKWDVQQTEAEREEMRQRYDANRKLYDEDPSIVRNPDGWGELPDGAEVIEP